MTSIHQGFIGNKQVKAMYVTSEEFFKVPLGAGSLNA